MLSLVIPTYQERDNLEPLMARLTAVRPLLGEPLEVLLVDSGSEDGTASCARELLKYHQLGRVIESAGKRGLAEAAAEGFRHAAGDLIGVMDADLSHPPELLPMLVRAARAGHRMVVASRYVPGGGVTGWSWRRRVLSRVGNLLARPLVRVADATSGFFVCDAQIVKRVRLKTRGFKILLEILVCACVHEVEEVPYIFSDRLRGDSKLNGQVLGDYLLQLGRLYRHRMRQPCLHPQPGR